MKTSTVRSRSVGANQRLDANYFTSAGVAAHERLALLEAHGIRATTIGDVAKVWAPGRFARAYAAPLEPGLPYLRPYDVFEFLPDGSDRLSLSRNDDLDRLRPKLGTLLQTCSGRNLGPVAIADAFLSEHAVSHDMVRIEIKDVELRHYVLAYLRTRTGQALLRRGRSGSVIDHITVDEVSRVPVPLDDRLVAEVAGVMSRACEASASARTRLSRLLGEKAHALPLPSEQRPQHEGWSLASDGVRGRLDAAYHSPRVAAAHRQSLAAGGTEVRSLATVTLPVRYKRYYVDPPHGRPILSGRQILQLEPVNLRHVSDRSFRDAQAYVVQQGMTIMAADGRSEGGQGTASLVTSERNDWLASDHVMRLIPHAGVNPGRVWLALSSPQARLQVNAMSFGSVVDELVATDVERVAVPPVSEAEGREAESAWTLFSVSNEMSRASVKLLESALGETLTESGNGAGIGAGND